MSKIPFTLDAWLKDKSRRVETRDGRVVHNIWRVKEPFYTNNRRAEVCALIDGEEDALVFFEGGRYLPTTKDTDSPFDLFIVTPEEELTEFEIRLLDWLSNDTSREIPMERMKEVVRNRATELRSLARKELENEAPSIIEAQSFREGFKAGKSEALKDVPKWKRIRKGEQLPETSYIWDFAYGERNGGGISTNWLLPNIPCVVGCDAWYIPVDVIKNLPREEEDNHE